MLGKVKWFNDARGYGFLIGENHDEYYFHRQEVADKTQPLVPGDTVSFDVQQKPKGPAAVRVKLLAPATAPKGGA